MLDVASSVVDITKSPGVGFELINGKMVPGLANRSDLRVDKEGTMKWGGARIKKDIHGTAPWLNPLDAEALREKTSQMMEGFMICNQNDAFFHRWYLHHYRELKKATCSNYFNYYDEHENVSNFYQVYFF